LHNASVKVASELRLSRRPDAAETKRRASAARNVLNGVNVTEVLDLGIVVDVSEQRVVETKGTSTSAAIRSRRTVVVTILIGVDRVVNTGDVVAVTASTAATASLVAGHVLTTVARITIAIEVTIGSTASIDAATSGQGGDIGVASNASR
jgi:hypothetical protein